MIQQQVLRVYATSRSCQALAVDSDCIVSAVCSRPRILDEALVCLIYQHGVSSAPLLIGPGGDLICSSLSCFCYVGCYLLHHD